MAKKTDGPAQSVMYYGSLLFAVIIIGGQINWTGVGCGGERKGYYYRYLQQDKPGQSYSQNPYAADFAWNKSFDGFIMPLAPNYEKKCPAGAPKCYYVLSEYGARGSGRHMGIDLWGTRIDNVVAPKDGTVTGIMVDHRTCGNGIEITHQMTAFTRYCHLTTMNIVKGQTVSQGQVLGTIGNTGAPGVTPHLHFELYVYLADKKKIAVNPRLLLPFDFPQSRNSILSRIKPLSEHLAVNKYWFSPEVYALARMLASETDDKEKEVLVVQAAVNRWRLWNAYLQTKNKSKVTIKDILTCAGYADDVSSRKDCRDWGPQVGRPYSTAKEGNLRQLVLSNLVLTGKFFDKAAKYGRPTYWLEPFAMPAPKTVTTAKKHAEWCKDRQFFIPSSYLGFDEHSIRFYAEKRFLTASGQAKLVKLANDPCLRPPQTGFDRQVDFVHPHM